MPKERIEFGPNQASGLEEVAGAGPASFNVVVEATGAVRRRPGIIACPDAPAAAVDESGIVALHRTEDGDLIAVGATEAVSTQIYRVRNGAAVNLSTDPSRRLLGTRRPTIVETEMLLVLAAGAAPQKVQLSDWMSERLGGDPPSASHVINNSLRLVLNDAVESRTTVRYSAQAIGTQTYAGHEVWAGGASGSFQAEARPDPVVALHDTANEVFIFGTKTLQVYGPDGTFVFVPVITREVGCIAPYSVVDVGGQFFWFSHEKRFVGSDGRAVNDLSSPALAQALSDIAVYDDCYGMRVALGRVDAALWTFPSDGRTFVLQRNGGWGQWASWSNGNYAPLGILCTHNAAGRCFVGMADGRIGEFSASAHTDLGTPIAAYSTTGFLDRGTSSTKQCDAVRLAIRHAAGSEGLVWLDWRDDLTDWCSIPIELDGGRGELSQVEFRGLGPYRRRQWRVRFDGTAEAVIASVEEEFHVVQ